jgi:hypothetical protein
MGQRMRGAEPRLLTDSLLAIRHLHMLLPGWSRRDLRHLADAWRGAEERLEVPDGAEWSFEICVADDDDHSGRSRH